VHVAVYLNDWFWFLFSYRSGSAKRFFTFVVTDSAETSRREGKWISLPRASRNLLNHEKCMCTYDKFPNGLQEKNENNIMHNVFLWIPVFERRRRLSDCVIIKKSFTCDLHVTYEKKK